MLLPDHISVGLLISSKFSFSKSSLYIFITFIAVILPDLPVVLFGAPGTIEYLAHRKYTNSVLLAPAYSLLPLILLSYWIIKNRSSYRIWLLYMFSLLGYYSHIFFDLITEYGTQLYYPISNRVYSLDILHSFDPIFIIISLSVISYYLYTYIKKRDVNFKVGYTIVGIYSLYMIFAIIHKEIYYEKFKDYLTSKEITFRSIEIIPRTYWRWRGVADVGNDYIVLLVENGEIESKRYNKNITLPDYIEKDSYYKQFIDYSRFPVIIDHNDGYALTNLIYSSESYKLIFNLSNNSRIQSKYITGFFLSDPPF